MSFQLLWARHTIAKRAEWHVLVSFALKDDRFRLWSKACGYKMHAGGPGVDLNSATRWCVEINSYVLSGRMCRECLVRYGWLTAMTTAERVSFYEVFCVLLEPPGKVADE